MSSVWVYAAQQHSLWSLRLEWQKFKVWNLTNNFAFSKIISYLSFKYEEFFFYWASSAVFYESILKKKTIFPLEKKIPDLSKLISAICSLLTTFGMSCNKAQAKNSPVEH